MTGQQTWIAVGVLIGFIVFITVRGELPAYLAIFQNATANATATGAAQAGLPGIAAIAKGLAQ